MQEFHWGGPVGAAPVQGKELERSRTKEGDVGDCAAISEKAFVDHKGRL